jgi:adenylate kinase
MKIVLLGPPGAGKGTQAKVLSKRLNLVHISTGDILRQNVSEKTELGIQAKGFMEKGALVPDELVKQMLANRIDEPNAEKGFILDGYPRNVKQAQALDKMLDERNMDIDCVFYLDSSEAVIIQRLSGRLVCTLCGENFHIKNMPPKVVMICDNCGNRLYQRSDDKTETIKRRLEIYRQDSAPVIDYYRHKKKLFQVDSDEEAELVLDKITRLIQENHDSCKV